MGTTVQAKVPSAILRARVTERPRRVRKPLSQPPAMLSTVTIV
jgi:hypothetical protein